MDYQKAKAEWRACRKRRNKNEIQRRVTRYKVYFDRSRMYISYVQFFLLLLVFTEAYRETTFGVWFYANKWLTLPAFLILFFFGSMVIGFLDRRYIRPGEQDELIETNPSWTKMRDKINDLHKKLCE